MLKFKTALSKDRITLGKEGSKNREREKQDQRKGPPTK